MVRLVKYLSALIAVLCLFVVSVSAQPLTLFGENAQCDVYPSDTFEYENGGRIDLEGEGCLFDLYKVNQAGQWIFLNEYQERLNTLRPYGAHYVVEMYCGCDFELAECSFFELGCEDGRPGIFEDCPAGYVDDENGNCVPTEVQRLQNQEDFCEASGKYWYNDVCNDVPNALASTQSDVTEGVAGLWSKLVLWSRSWLFWVSFVVVYFFTRKLLKRVPFLRWLP